MFGHHRQQHTMFGRGPWGCDPRSAESRGGGRDERGFGGRGFGPRGFEGFGGRGFGGGGGRERLFDAGDLQLILLQLIAEKPSYGYELIKAIEDRMGGGYAPSPGVVYPTLTLLEERGFAQIEPGEGTRKVYAITEEGRAELERNAERMRELSSRVDRTGQRFRRGRSPEVMRAFGELRRAVLRAALRGRESGEGLPDGSVAKMVEAIEHAAQVIDTL